MKRIILRSKRMIPAETLKKEFLRIYETYDKETGILMIPNDFEFAFEPGSWIKLDFAAPKRYQDLILCDKNGIEYIGTYDDLDRFVARTGEKIEDVVAWMPAPEPYED